ncbi:MAG: GTP 3',8-cyclase MoaA [Clostridia bacterium]|nr:GTP 3',8-cyclase MoaA [Clostridia bacterium]
MKDFSGREINYLRLSITELCNLRCRYFMPEDGICKKDHKASLTEDEMIAAVEAAASLGITKLRITGGEPLVKRNIMAICARAANVPGIQEVCITTNGILLPKLAKGLRAAGVSRINLSLDTLDPEKYARITRIGSLSQALAGLEAAIQAGFDKIKVNAVLIGGFNDDEILPLAELTKRYPVDVRFIELMPMVDSLEFGEDAFIPCSAVLDHLPEAEPVKHDGGVARLYRLPGALGSIGLISPVSDHFCGACNRIRLTADGKLKPCLHSSEELSLKGLTLEEMREQMKRAIEAKPSCHGELSAKQHSLAGRNMNQIGG